jgi:hypothetical protein
MTILDAGPRLLITDADQMAGVAEALGSGAVVGHAFGNFYAITTRAEADTVRTVNLMKGRAPGQVGSITGPPDALTLAWDLDLLPDGLPTRTALSIVDRLFSWGPFGFRGPAAAGVPAHLSELDGDIRTAQVIAPGYRCPSNALLAAARRATGGGFLYITSANRSRHQTGAQDSPAHWRAEGLRAEFGDHPGFLIVEHLDEAAARARHPRHLPTSTSVLGLHRVLRVPGDPRPHLVLERHGSLPAELVRQVLGELGYGLVLGPRARTRLLLRDYTERLSDR